VVAAFSAAERIKGKILRVANLFDVLKLWRIKEHPKGRRL
jgi:hypothetical protein